MKIDSKLMHVLQEIESQRGIPRVKLVEVLKEALATAYAKTYGNAGNLHIDVSLSDGGEISVYIEKRVVDSVTDQENEITLDDARDLDGEADVGDSLMIEVSLDDLGLLAIHHAKQKIVNLIKDQEREMVYEEFRTKLYQIVTGSVLYADKRDIFVEVGKIEGIIPKNEQIPTEQFRTGDKVKALLIEVRYSSKAPMLVLSRSHPDLLRRLMENEIPELREGSIEIRGIARDPGYRAKVAVKSNIPELDPVGSCIGSKGIRILSISSEVADEKIDLVSWKEDSFEFIAESLSPAKVYSVEIFETERRALVIVPDDQISLAIGKGWRNVKLASKLTKYYLEVKSVSEANLSGEIKVSDESE